MTKPTSHTTYDGKLKVLKAYREWVECTGVVSVDGGYYFEMESFLDDAYAAGLEDAAHKVLDYVSEYKEGRLIRIAEGIAKAIRALKVTNEVITEHEETLRRLK